MSVEEIKDDKKIDYLDVDNNALYHEHLIHFTEKTLEWCIKLNLDYL